MPVAAQDVEGVRRVLNEPSFVVQGLNRFCYDNQSVISWKGDEKFPSSFAMHIYVRVQFIQNLVLNGNMKVSSASVTVRNNPYLFTTTQLLHNYVHQSFKNSHCLNPILRFFILNHIIYKIIMQIIFRLISFSLSSSGGENMVQ